MIDLSAALTWSTMASSYMCLPLHSMLEETTQLFKSYLYPRTCKVNISKSFLSDQDLCFSVPQGSLCGPVLYNAYTNTMRTTVSPAIAIHRYADVHALKKEEADTAQSLSDCLNKVKEWMNSCHLKMHSNKTEIILFGSWQQLKKCRLTAPEVCAETIPYNESIKYLGVLTDHNTHLHHHYSLQV